MESKITTNLEVDEPLEQDALYRLGPEDRQYIDNQARGVQKHLVDALIRGRLATYIPIANGNTLAVGQGACLGVTGSVPTVALAVAANLTTAVSVFGVVVLGGVAGSYALIAHGGVLPPEITGLAGVSKGFVRVNTTTGALERVAALSEGDYGIGTVTDNGYMHVVPGIGVAETNPLALPLDLGDNSEIIGVAPVAKGGTAKVVADLAGQAGKALVVNPGETGYDLASFPSAIVPTGTGFRKIVGGVEQAAAEPVDLADPTERTGLLPIASVAPGTNGFVAQTVGGVAVWAAPASTAPVIIANSTTGTANDIASDSAGTPATEIDFTGASVTLTSIAGGTAGRRVTLLFRVAAGTIQHDSGGTAANRIVCPGGRDFFVPTGGAVDVIYSSSDSRWYVLAQRATPPTAVGQDRLVDEQSPQEIYEKTLMQPIVKTASGNTMATAGTVEVGTVASEFIDDDWRILSVINRVNTSATTTVSLIEFAMADDTFLTMSVALQYTRQGAVTKAAWYRLSVGYRRTGGGDPTIVGTLDKIVGGETTSADDVTIDVDATTDRVRVRITPADADARSWTAEARIQEQNDAA